MQYYYFHGFKGSPKSKKSLIMQEVLGAENVSSPDFNLENAEAVKAKLDGLAKSLKKTDTTIIGSSLGGLYALYVSALADVNCILLNPCLFPQLIITTLTDDYIIDDVILAQKLNLEAFKKYTPELIRVWLTKDDNISDHKILTKPFFYKGLKEYKVFPKKEAQEHGFKGFKSVLKRYL